MSRQHGSLRLQRSPARLYRQRRAPSRRRSAATVAGWSARGGTAVTVGQNDTLNTLSLRYGVPAAALMKANGLTSPAEVKSGMHIVVPVYSAGGRAVADASPRAGKPVAEIDS